MEAKVLHLRWTSIHVHKLASSIEISGAGMRGKVIHVSVGLDMLGSFRAKDSRFTSDGAFAVLLAKDSFICDAGCKPGILVLLLCVAAKTGYMVFDREYILRLGLRLKRTLDNSASAESEHVTLIHCCCKSGSLLSTPAQVGDIRTTDITK